MPNLKILFIAGYRMIENPMCGNWINGLSNLGHRVVSLCWHPTDLSRNQLANWGIFDKIPVFTCFRELPETLRNSIIFALGGEPDILFCWEGIPALKPLRAIAPCFQDAKVIFLIDTYPNAPHLVSELLHIFRYSASNSLIDAYVFYSEAMRVLFSQQIFLAHKKPYLALIEPFLKSAFDLGDINIPQQFILDRVDGNPYVIFTGNTKLLWSSRYKEARDALGKFLSQLAARGVHIFVNPEADLKGIKNLHLYPSFPGADLFEGRFAQYISQFDAHLLLYNECNGTIRRRVASGLSTRLAFALTSTCPVAVSHNSKFIHEYWTDYPFGFTFKNLEDLVESLCDQEKLSALRANMEKVHFSFSFEAQGGRINQFLNGIIKHAFQPNEEWS